MQLFISMWQIQIISSILLQIIAILLQIISILLKIISILLQIISISLQIISFFAVKTHFSQTYSTAILQMFQYLELISDLITTISEFTCNNANCIILIQGVRGLSRLFHECFI